MNVIVEKIMKKSKICVLLLLMFLLSCEERMADVDVVALYHEMLGEEVADTVRIFDASVKEIDRDRVKWIAFDVSDSGWLKQQHDLELQKYAISGMPFGLVTGRSDMQTGFEGYLDDDFDVYTSKDEAITGKFYSRNMNGYFRVVYYEIGF